MMFFSGHLISSADIATGVLVVAVLVAWTAMAAMAVVALRRTGSNGAKGAVLGGALVLGGVLLSLTLFDRMLSRDLGAERLAIESRTAELLARAIAPGSVLTCLDAMASPAVETGCEKALFARPEAVAAALAYVNAQYSLLAASVALAERDPGYRPAVDRLRRGIEEDRYGLVAQVLTTRGCTAPDCADLAILRDSRRILANMKSLTFATHVEANTAAWDLGAAAPAFASASPSGAPSPPSAAAPTPAAPELAATTSVPAPAPGERRKVRYEYPTSDSIPAVSIMDVEQDPPGTAEPKAAPPKRAAPRRQTTHERAPAEAPPPPTAILPQAQTQPQTSGAR